MSADTASPSSICRAWRLIALLLALWTVGLMGACGRPSVPHPSASSPTSKGEVVARVQQSDPEAALGEYLEGWRLHFNDVALRASARPDATSPSNMITAVSFSIKPLSSPSSEHTAYRADFEFWRGNPASSAQQPVVLTSTATYDVSRDEQGEGCIITLTSAPPDEAL